MMDWGNGGSGGDWAAMGTAMILFWALLIGVAVWVVRTARGGRGSTGEATHADTLLAERFARGEIDGEEFSRQRELLHSGGPAQPTSGT